MMDWYDMHLCQYLILWWYNVMVVVEDVYIYIYIYMYIFYWDNMMTWIHRMMDIYIYIMCISWSDMIWMSYDVLWDHIAYFPGYHTKMITLGWFNHSSGNAERGQKAMMFCIHLWWLPTLFSGFIVLPHITWVCGLDMFETPTDPQKVCAACKRPWKGYV